MKHIRTKSHQRFKRSNLKSEASKISTGIQLDYSATSSGHVWDKSLENWTFTSGNITKFRLCDWQFQFLIRLKAKRIHIGNVKMNSNDQLLKWRAVWLHDSIDILKKSTKLKNVWISFGDENLEHKTLNQTKLIKRWVDNVYDVGMQRAPLKFLRLKVLNFPLNFLPTLAKISVRCEQTAKLIFSLNFRFMLFSET